MKKKRLEDALIFLNMITFISFISALFIYGFVMMIANY